MNAAASRATGRQWHRSRRRCASRASPRRIEDQLLAMFQQQGFVPIEHSTVASWLGSVEEKNSGDR